MTNNKIKIVYFGTPSIALSTIEYLYTKEDIEIAAVVTQPDRPAGRGHKIMQSPIKEFALSHNIEVLQPEKIRTDKDCIERLKQISPDFFVTFAFGQILSQEILDIPKNATINLHGSLLPKYRGANPIQRCIYNGDCETGITTMITRLELDSGPICLQQKIPLSKDTTSLELEKIISEESPFLIYRTLKGLEAGTIIPTEQDSGCVCFADKFKKEDARIDWNDSSKDIHNKVRAFANKPNAFIIHNNKNVKILETQCLEVCSDGNCQTGEIVKVSKEGIEVRTKDGSILIKKVRPESKNEMSGADWANGMKFKAHDSLKEE